MSASTASSTPRTQGWASPWSRTSGYLMGSDDMQAYWATFVARALLAVPGHAIWAGMMGYFAARRRFDKTGPGIIGGFALAWVLHGSYDAALSIMPLGSGLR